jgi:hypothetical protein
MEIQDIPSFGLPTPEVGLQEAKQRLARTLRPGELVWLLGEQFDPSIPVWTLELLRQGDAGSWVRRRYRFDEHAQVLFFLGEQALSDAEFRETRRTGTLFPADRR